MDLCRIAASIIASINIADSDVLDKMAEVEGAIDPESGKRFIQQQEEWNARGADSTLEAAKKWLVSLQGKIENETDPEEQEWMKESLPRKTHVVYGLGGSSRWYVRGDGSIDFSASHAYNDERVDKARELGFGIN